MEIRGWKMMETTRNRGLLWTGPKCNERIEDQFDSCWKCAGQVQNEPNEGSAGFYPVWSVISFGMCAVLVPVSTLFGFGNGFITALLGAIFSWSSIWAFLNCPPRHW